MGLLRAMLCLGLCGCGVSGCGVSDGGSASRIEGLRLIAVRAEPPEAAPGTPVELIATFAGGDAPAAIDWAWCATPKPPTENNSVAEACLADGVTPIGTAGARTQAALPADGCRLFGPESPGPGLRPRDPDLSGGYYQPVVLRFAEGIGVGMVRLRCTLAQAPLSDAQRYAAEYVDNQHPTIELAPVSPDAAGTVTLRAMPDAPEDYLRFDPVDRVLVEDTERLTVSWFSTNGTIATEQTDVVDGTATVAWSVARPAVIHAVLRDDRGGVAVATLTVP